jgi:hypothetical protein
MAMTALEWLRDHWKGAGTILGAALYIWVNHKDLPFWPRTAKVASSALIGLVVAPEIVEKWGTSPYLTLASVMVLAWVVIDGATTILRNPKEVLAEILRRYGGGK